MSDVVRALADRWPAVHVITCASLVQGVHAPRAVINALALLQEHPLVDVIVVARGGGSVQDLACFDDEGLCRTLFACETPVVCAIGHTDNNPVCNHVTWSAYTPSRSAEMVVPALTDVRQVLARATDRLDRIPGQLQLGRERVEAVSRHLDVEGILDERRIAVRQSAALGAGALTTRLTSRAHAIELAHAILSSVPRSAALELSNERETLVSASATLAQTRARVTALATETADLARQAQAGVNAGLKDAARELAHLTEVIAARDFRRRGWLLAGDKDGQPVRSVADLEAGSRIHLQLHDGGAEAAVKEINPVARTT